MTKRTRQDIEALAIEHHGFKPYETLTDRELDANNEEAWGQVAQALRDKIAQGLDIDEARSAVDADLVARSRGNEEIIRRALLAKANKSDIRFAAYAICDQSIIGCQKGFVWDVEL